jgi:hypothetical protein
MDFWKRLFTRTETDVAVTHYKEPIMCSVPLTVSGLACPNTAKWDCLRCGLPVCRGTQHGDDKSKHCQPCLNAISKRQREERKAKFA